MDRWSADPLALETNWRVVYGTSKPSWAVVSAGTPPISQAAGWYKVQSRLGPGCVWSTRFWVGPSNIDDAGLGLFLATPLRNGATVGYLFGFPMNDTFLTRGQKWADDWRASELGQYVSSLPGGIELQTMYCRSQLQKMNDLHCKRKNNVAVRLQREGEGNPCN